MFIVLTQGDHVLEGHGYVSITLSMSVPLESQIYKVTITILYFGINYFCVAAHLLFLKATKKKDNKSKLSQLMPNQMEIN